MQTQSILNNLDKKPTYNQFLIEKKGNSFPILSWADATDNNVETSQSNFSNELKLMFYIYYYAMLKSMVKSQREIIILT